MTEACYPVPAQWAKDALIDAAGYDRMYAEASSDPDGFWLREAQRLDWIVQPTLIKNTSFDESDFRIRWFEDGQLNVAANCVDRHAAARPDATAILWEGDDPADSRAITYAELRDEVSRLANALKAQGVRKGEGKAARGTTSHYNVATRFDGMIFEMMGTLILLNTIAVVWLCVEYRGR